MSDLPPPPNAPVLQPAQPRGQGAYASWGSRAVAYLLDGLMASAIGFAGFIPIAASAGTIDPDTGSVTGGSAVLTLLGFGLFLLAIVFNIWNVGWRQGTTGQSIGKGVMDISVITTGGQFLGGGMGIVRMLLQGILGGACLLNYLWPLWDDHSQTWTDKIIDTIVVRA